MSSLVTLMLFGQLLAGGHEPVNGASIRPAAVCVTGQTESQGVAFLDQGAEIPTGQFIYFDGAGHAHALSYDQVQTLIKVTGGMYLTQSLYVADNGVVGPISGGSPAPLLLRGASSDNQAYVGVQLSGTAQAHEPIAHLHEVQNGFANPKGFFDIQGFYNIDAPHPAAGRKFGWWAPSSNAATTFTASGNLAAPSSPTGTASAQPALTSATSMHIQYAGSAASNDVTGLNGGSFAQTRSAYRPKGVFRWRTDSAITNRRIWTGITESTLATLAVATGPGASGIDFVAVGYESGVNSGKFMCCSGDGTNYSCSDIAVTAAVSTEYVTVLDWTTAGTLVCCALAPGAVGGYQNGCVEKTTNLSTAAVDLGLYLATTTTNSSALNTQISSVSLEWR